LIPNRHAAEDCSIDTLCDVHIFSYTSAAGSSQGCNIKLSAHTVLQHWSTAGVFKAGSNLDKLHCLQRGTNSAARQEAVLIIPALDSVAWPSKSLKKSLGQELKQ
jgi:hypothetical protein